jgi:hypothetical protein
MKKNAKDYVSIAQQFFTAYDAHDVDGMLGGWPILAQQGWGL